MIKATDTKIRKIPVKTALIIIDVQKGFDDPIWGKRNNPKAEQNIKKLLEVWRTEHRPIFHIKHMSKNAKSPLNPNHSGNQIKEEVWPQKIETVIEKNVNSAIIWTDLEERLRKEKIQTVIITGLTTDHCVSTTARMAGNLGFTTFVVADGTATFNRIGYDGKEYSAELIHETTLASLNNEFAEVIDTESILKNL